MRTVKTLEGFIKRGLEEDGEENVLEMLMKNAGVAG